LLAVQLLSNHIVLTELQLMCYLVMYQLSTLVIDF